MLYVLPSKTSKNKGVYTFTSQFRSVFSLPFMSAEYTNLYTVKYTDLHLFYTCIESTSQTAVHLTKASRDHGNRGGGVPGVHMVQLSFLTLGIESLPPSVFLILTGSFQMFVAFSCLWHSVV